MSIISHFPVLEEEDKLLQLMQENPVFNKVVSQGNGTPEEMNEARIAYNNFFPDGNFNVLLKSNNDDICENSLVFDTKTKKHYNPLVLNPIRRNKVEIFDLNEFIRNAMINNQACFLNFDVDPEIEFDEKYETKARQTILASQALKSIASIALNVNQNRKEIPYSIMEVITEKYIN